jgi:hypothetical protein
MNERFKQLSLEAGGSHYPTINPQMQQRFAELIVKEMLQTCEDHPAWTGRMIGEQIKQHFGVEE